MGLLEPLTAIIAAAIALPLLLALYILKLRRRPHRMASTMLWRQAFEDLKVNVPFRRLRASLLLVLQLIALACIILALGQPVGPAANGGFGARVVLLLDRGASMSARTGPAEAAPTRLDAAKASAVEIVERLARGRGTPEVTVIAFGATPEIVASFGAPTGELVRAIEAVVPSDEPSDLEAALDLASVFAAGAGEGAAASEPPDAVLISDGCVRVPDDAFSVRAGRFRHERVSTGAEDDPGNDPTEAAEGRRDADRPPLLPHADNVGIVDLGARRERDDPARVAVFARLASVRGRASDIAVELLVDGTLADTTVAELPAADGAGPGTSTITFDIVLPRGAVIAVRLAAQDMLPSDDTAALVLPAPLEPRIAIVHPGTEPDPDLVSILEAFEPAEMRFTGPAAWAALDTGDVDVGRVVDLVVFDRVPADRLPGIPSLSFGGVPAGLELVEGADPDLGRRVLAWDRAHPLLRNVALDGLVFRRFTAFADASGAQPLVTGPEGPIALALRSRGATHVVVGFSLEESNWPLDLSFAVFMQNAMDQLLLGRSGAARLARPGDPVVVRAAAGNGAVVVDGPGLDAPRTVEAAGAAAVTLPRLPRAGLYTVSGVEARDAVIATSVLAPEETDIRPRAVRAVATDADRALSTGATRRDLRPLLVAIALGILALEWILYCRRVASG